MTKWLAKEKELGSENPDRMILATASVQGMPHSRVVAIREISPKGILFFTQTVSRKVKDITENPVASMTLWLALQQREVIADGVIEPLTQEENLYYWNTLSRERQLRYSAYSPTTGQPITSIKELEKVYLTLSEKFPTTLPMSEFYCGFRLVPNTFYFYTLGIETFSEVIQYVRDQDTWRTQLLSP